MHGLDHPGQHDAPGATRALVVLAGSMVLALSTWFSTTAVAPQLRSELGLTASDWRWTIVSLQLGFAAGALLAAAAGWPDRWSPRLLAAAGALAAAAANLLPVAAPSPSLSVLVTSRALTGACLALVYPSLLKAVSTWFRIGRGTALASMIAALTLGTASPHLVGASFSVGPSWRAVLVVTSVLAATAAVVLVRAVGDGPFLSSRSRFDPRALPAIARDRATRLACIGYFGHMWELYAAWAFLPAYFRSHTTTDRAAALLTFTTIGAGAVGCLAGARLGLRVGRATAARQVLITSSLLAIGVGFVHGGSLALVVPICVAWGIALIADGPQFTTLVAEHAPAERVGTAITVQLALGFALTSVTLWLVPAVQQHAGWPLALAVLVPGPLVGAAAMLALEPAVPTTRIPSIPPTPTPGAAPWTSATSPAAAAR